MKFKNGLLILLAVFGLQAQADYLQGNPTYTGPSGIQGDTSELVGDYDPISGLNHIAFGENRDIPTFVRVGQNNINDNLDGFTRSYSIDYYRPSSVKTAFFNPASNIYVGAIQICTPRGKDRLKGITIWGRRYDDSLGRLVDYSREKVAKRANCGRARLAAICPTGKVASRVQVYS